MFSVHSGILPHKLLEPPSGTIEPHIQVSEILVDAAAMEIACVHARFATRPEGLTTDEARADSLSTAPTCWPRTSGRESANCSGTR